jgi:hypothetical protein
LQPLPLLIKRLLQNAPRDAEKLEWLLKKKEKAKEGAMHTSKIHKG